jgi:hypothetical protein
MTDIQIVAPEATFPCPEPDCDRVFGSANALQGHKIAHMPPQSCPECGKTYKSVGALGNHRRTAHGVPGVSPSAIISRAKTRTRRNGNLPDIEVDHIFASVLQVLFPSGTMPITAVVPLLQWREATQEFLEKVQS